MAFYNVGEKVTYNPRGIPAKVVRVLPNDIYAVEWDDQSLIPPIMEVPGSHLSPETIDWFGAYDFTKSLPTGDHCPRCGNKWKETWIGHKAYYDCIQCNIKKEES